MRLTTAHTREVARRILAAVAAAIAIVALFPDRLPGAATTTTTTPEDVLGLLGIDHQPHPDPLRLYPRRPGARYEDVESRPGHGVQLGFDRMRIAGWSRESHAALPAKPKPPALTSYREANLLDDYVPVVTDAPGDVLRVRVTHWGSPFASDLRCVATEAADGTELVPYRVPTATSTTKPAARKPAPKRQRSTTTTNPLGVSTITSTLYFPVGAYRGRVYLACSSGALVDLHAVWALDV
jgi:hypothetical protein